MFEIIKVANYEEMSDKAFEVMKEVVANNPKCVLGLATGSSPIGMYQRMIKDHKENGTSYAEVTTFNLDEYCGLPKSHPESYYSFMHRNLFSGLNIKEENVHIPEDGEDKEAKCKELNQGAPVILDYLCDECKTHFENVKNGLDELGIKYTVDSNIVRGLDYYTKTVFEFISKRDGYTVLAGGRYDGLVKELGGQDTPAIGFAAGEERLISLLQD